VYNIPTLPDSKIINDGHRSVLEKNSINKKNHASKTKQLQGSIFWKMCITYQLCQKSMMGTGVCWRKTQLIRKTTQAKISKKCTHEVTERQTQQKSSEGTK